MKKLEMLLEDESNLLYRCIYCNSLFTLDQTEYLKCKNAKIFIDFHGNVIAKHVSDRAWNLNKFINYLHTTCKLHWRDIYWKIWSYTLLFSCSHCDCFFRGAELNHCAYHTQNPIFTFGSNKGM
jgi:hypothetical protein